MTPDSDETCMCGYSLVHVHVRKPIEDAGFSTEMHECGKGLRNSLCFDQVTLCINVG